MNSNSVNDLVADHGVGRSNLVYGLDSLRFFTAMWVAFSHGANFPIASYAKPDNLIGKILFLISRTTFNGTAAVAVFFVISGFLIHGANLKKEKIDASNFLIRRLVRIIFPLIAVLIIAIIVGSKYYIALADVLWSVYAEIIYYLIYPILFIAIRKFSIGTVLAFSFAISILMIALNRDCVYLWSFGNGLTWLFCLPLWLAGCLLAEKRAYFAKASEKIPVVAFRFLAIFYCLASTILATHLGNVVIGYTWTIWFFGIFCMYWLAAEMHYGFARHPGSIFEKFGLAGYSLYLTHKLVLTFCDDRVSLASPLLLWLLKVAGVLVGAWLFYRTVEWPSHRLARALGKRKAAAALG